MQLVVLRLVVLRLLSSSSKSPSRWSVRASSQSLFEALLKGASGLAIELLQFGVETGKPLLGGLVGRLLVGPLEALGTKAGKDQREIPDRNCSGLVSPCW